MTQLTHMMKTIESAPPSAVFSTDQAVREAQTQQWEQQLSFVQQQRSSLSDQLAQPKQELEACMANMQSTLAGNPRRFYQGMCSWCKCKPLPSPSPPSLAASALATQLNGGISVCNPPAPGQQSAYCTAACQGIAVAAGWDVHGALEPLSRQLRLTLNVLGEHIEDLPYMDRLPS